MAYKKRPKNLRTMSKKKQQEKAEEIESRKTSEYHDLEQGWNYFFLMPPWSDKNEIWKEVEKHGMHVCPRQYDRDCIMCKEIKKRLKRGDIDFSDKWRGKTRGYFNAIRKADIKKADADCVKVLNVSPSVFNFIMEWINDEDIDISNPEAAHMVCIKRTGSGLRTRYKTKITSESYDISDYITEEVLNGLADLDAIRAVQPASDRDLRKEIRGTADDDDDDDEDDEDINEDIEDDEDDAGDDDIEDELFSDDDDDDDDGGDDEDDADLEDDDDDSDDSGDAEKEDDDEEEDEDEPPPPKRTKETAGKKKVVKKTSKKTSKKKARRI